MSGERNSSNLGRNPYSQVVPRDSYSPASIASLNGHALLPNVGIPLDLHWLQEVRVNTSAVERRAQSQVARRTVKKEWQAAWLLRSISCMDLTTLSGDDTDERVRRLCAKAKQPLQQELVENLGIANLGVKVAAVCVYHTFIETALQRARRQWHSCSRSLYRISSWTFSAGRARGRDSPVSRSGSARDRCGHHARARFRRTLASSIRRSRRF